MRGVGVNDALDVRARAQHLRMDEHLVVARHAAADLLAVEIDGDDVVERHLVEADGGGLHQEAPGVIRQPRRYVTGDEVALVLAGEDAPCIGELSPERLGHGFLLSTAQPFVPAEAGTQSHSFGSSLWPWIPAFAGMNGVCGSI